MSYKQDILRMRDNIILKTYQYLSEEQKNAVLFGNKNIVVIACPGAGKTTTLISKVHYLTTFGPIYNSDWLPKEIYKEDVQILKDYYNEKVKTANSLKRAEYILRYFAVKEENIIVTTFTRAAAINMKNKYKKQFDKYNTPFFGTFHGLFYKILKNYYKEINIIDEKDKYKLIKSTLLNYIDEISEEKVKDIVNDISSFKCKDIPIEDYNSCIDKSIFKSCYEVYEFYKNSNKLLDFDDMQIMCKELLLKKGNLLKIYKRQFKYILIDEFQDCDVFQIDILKLFNDSYIFAVGDEDQSIYSFRGARPDCMVSFTDIFSLSKKLFLTTNYRSGENIINISKRLIKQNRMRNHKEMKSYKNMSSTVAVKEYFNEALQGDGVSLNINELIKCGKYKYSDNAVLYRTNIESRSIIDSFIKNNIPFKLLDKQFNFFNHFICKDIIAYLRISLDASDINNFQKIINKPFRYISRVNLQKMSRSGFKEDCFDQLMDVEGLPIFQIKKIEELKKDIRRIQKMTPNSAIVFILYNLCYYDYIKEYTEKFKLSMDEYDSVIDELQSSAENFNSILNFLIHVDKVSEEIEKNKFDENEDRVILSTIHGVKGMEFKSVFIINCNEENIPHINSIENNLEEERRLLYVGFTRAIENLQVSSVNNIRGVQKYMSRFIKECSKNENPY